MPGWLRKALLAGMLAGVLGGCGSEDGTIPPAASEAMLGRLAAVEQAIASGDCDLAEAQATELVTEVNALPAEVGAETKEALRQAATNVATLATDPDECAPTGATGETGEQPTDTETTTTDETTEETTTEEQPDEETDETQEQPPTEEGPPPPDEGTDGGPDGGGDGSQGPGNPTGGIEGSGGGDG